MTKNQNQAKTILENSSTICLSNMETWTLFLAISKNKNVNWYGTNALLRGPSGNNIIICRSYEVGSKIHSQILILREVLVRLKELKIKSIVFFDHKKIWFNLISSNKEKIHWEIYPAFCDIYFLINQMQGIQYIHSWHPLSREAQKLALNVSTIRIFSSWP